MFFDSRVKDINTFRDSGDQEALQDKLHELLDKTVDTLSKIRITGSNEPRVQLMGVIHTRIANQLRIYKRDFRELPASRKAIAQFFTERERKQSSFFSHKVEAHQKSAHQVAGELKEKKMVTEPENIGPNADYS